MDLPQAKNEFAEIPIRGDQQCLVLIGLAYYGIVVNTWIKLRNVAHRVAVRSEAVHDWPIYTLLRQEIHAPCPAAG